MPIPMRAPLRFTRLALARSTWTAVYPLLIEYFCPYRKEWIGQGSSRARLDTFGPAPPDPRGLRARNQTWPPVQRDDGFVGNADLGTPPLRRGGGQGRPLQSRHRAGERDLRPER